MSELSRRDQFVLKCLDVAKDHDEDSIACIAVELADQLLSEIDRTSKPEPVKAEPTYGPLPEHILADQKKLAESLQGLANKRWREYRASTDIPTDEMCLLRTDDGAYRLGCWSVLSLTWLDANTCTIKGVTHWMPITGPETGGEGK